MKWVAVFTAREAEETKQFVQALCKVGPGMGFAMAQPKAVQIKDSRAATYVQELGKV